MPEYTYAEASLIQALNADREKLRALLRGAMHHAETEGDDSLVTAIREALNND